ncbi:membrane-bound serine protease (ClpP class) [Dehalogenimonas formicexedens]|uniref:Membrane-bound serine protease (ClpP class) n=1 Tax=Dehalogenimonas formicexedens TaxID=1839801 RepID=A0A1P8F6I7_9CHLR|nr:NfeD family protein [Dehalogenimonas formicexedens]APV44058.1 membrane-bound serine protease (ClpP class) [Dehalogenimonas formicexedens]
MNLVGILLVLLGIALFIAEFFTSGYALFGAAGLFALILGLILIFDFTVPVWVTVTLFVLMLVFAFTATVLVFRRVAEAQKQKVATGHEELIGKKATVRAQLNPSGTVFIDGEIWSAQVKEGRAEVGEEVVVTGIDGLNLYVAKIQEGA